MAKSKSGGTRSYLRGRIANDVYSIGKDGNGKKQQVVRSLAESVANPQTIAQMRGRMIMSTVMQAVSGLSYLIDHSFDGIASGQPSISEFIRRNYALIKADVAAHPASGNEFALNDYQEKGVKAGRYIVSDGKGAYIYNAEYGVSNGAKIQFAGIEATTTFADLKNLWEVGVDGFMTLVWITPTATARFFRVRLASGIADSTVITSENVATMFSIEDPFDNNISVTLANETITIGSTSSVRAVGLIGSYYSEGAGYVHTYTKLQVADNIGDSSDEVLPTYPEGSQRFLNGGEL